MRRGLDHVVHLVRDLDAAGEIYDLLGFTVGSRNRHPWGTENRIVQTPGFFIELLQIVDPEQVPPDQPRSDGDDFFSFGAFNKRFLERHGEGLSMLVLEGSDPVAEKAAFDAAGFGGFETFDFARTARRADGQEVEVGFSLAFARDPEAPDFGAFTCAQKLPENFWSADMQRHSNQVSAVAGVVLVAEVPSRHQAFLETLSGGQVQRALNEWFVGQTPRGSIDVMTPGLFTERYGVPAPGTGELRLAAVRFHTRGAPELRRSLAARRMVEEAIAGIIVVPPRAALGATLVFELTPA
ncbi:VOC family protein [Xanthobacter autotrophicus DSM 431]|uniref:VOC family protein n=1 Tax=Xanthobacter nonsaccharivorans TaxID=3119912 RepID=UPI003727FBE2